MSIETYRERLEDLGRHLGLAALAPNEANVCSLAVGDDGGWLHISWSEEDDQVHWTTVLGSLVMRDASSLFPTLLAANLDWSLTRGGYFAYDDFTHAVLYRFHESADHLDTPRFLAITERFVGAADFWRARLASAIERLPVVGTEPADATSDSPPFMQKV